MELVKLPPSRNKPLDLKVVVSHPDNLLFVALSLIQGHAVQGVPVPQGAIITVRRRVLPQASQGSRWVWVRLGSGG